MGQRLEVLIVAVIAVCLFSTSTMASFSGAKGSLGLFFPRYGSEIKRELETMNIALDTDLELTGSLAIDFGLEYSLSSKWRILGELFVFDSETSDSYTYYSEDQVKSGRIKVKVTFSGLIFNVVYKPFSSKSFCPYVGAGVGLFSSEKKISGLAYEPGLPYIEYSEREGFTGSQFLGGIEWKGEAFYSLVEIRYLNAKGAGIDWSGLSFGIGIGIDLYPYPLQKA